MNKVKARFKEIYYRNDNMQLLINILIIWVLSRVIMLIMVPVHNVLTGASMSTGIVFLMNMWDAKHYKSIILHGYTFPSDYDAQANWAFFPLYPMICAFVRLLTFNTLSAFISGMLVSNVCIIIAAFFGVKYIRENRLLSDKIKGAELVLPVLLFAGPYAFYAGSTYTESLFIMNIVLFFYFAQRREFLKAGLFAMLSSATRIVGCILVFALIIELFLDYKERTGVNKKEDIKVSIIKVLGGFVTDTLKTPKKLFSIMICPFGTFAYMFFLYFFCGDAWAFKSVQIAWREDEFFPVIGVLFKACFGQLEPRFTYMGWFCIATLILYVYMFIRKHYSMAVFGIISLLIPLTSHVLSTCRFTVGTFVFYIGVYELIARLRKPVRVLLLSVLVIIEAVMLFYWYCENYWLM